MSNSNTISEQLGAISVLTANTTGIQAFQVGSNPAIVWIPGSSRCTNRVMRVRASGKATGGTTTNVTLSLLYGTSATVGSNTVMYASSAVAVNSTTMPFLVEADLIVDDKTQKMCGKATNMIGNTLGALAALGTQATAVDLTAENTNGLQFAVTFSAANASNSATLTDFSLELL